MRQNMTSENIITDATAEPAIFYDVDHTYKADTCKPLHRAGLNGELIHQAFARRSYPGRRLPDDMLPELCVVCLWDAKHDQNWGLPPHRNEGVELGYLTRGKLDFIVDGKPYHLNSGDLTVTRPWQPHQVGNPNISASRMHWLIIDVDTRRPNDLWKWPKWLNFAPRDLEYLTELLRYNEQPVWRGNERIERCFENIAQLYENPEIESVHTRLQLYINELFLEVFEMLQHSNIALDSNLASTKRSVEMFLEALSSHLDYPWTLEIMAKHCDLHRTRFAHYCRQITNKSPAEYLTERRVNKAKELLIKFPDKTVTDIAFICGFESSQYFAKVFKCTTGRPPSEFRKQ